jgi:hypothetical protein
MAKEICIGAKVVDNLDGRRGSRIATSGKKNGLF